MDESVLRILDVGLNRAREALRVIEDFARFARDDRAVAELARHLRHELRFIAQELGMQRLLAARDAAGDVGRPDVAAPQPDRSTPEEVAQAALARLAEAARSIAEYARIVDPQVALRAEQLRFQAYDLQQRIVLRSELVARLRAVRLYVIITRALCRGDWLQTAEAALDGGAGCIQLREKQLPDRQLLAAARALRELTARRGALLIVNDRPDIARLCGADGVHVGQDDLSVAEARSIGGGRLLVGQSTHTLEQLQAALLEQPDYVALGPMFPSPTKPGNALAGPEMLRAAADRTPLPLVAIGGIRADNVEQVIRAGASCAAVCSAVVSDPDPRAAARAILERIAAVRL